MNRPGFALLRYGAAERKVSVVKVSHVDNKTKRANQVKPDGSKLFDTAQEIKHYLLDISGAFVVVREAMLKSAPSASTLKTLAKVVGVSDLLTWSYLKADVKEISPSDIRRILTGDAKADKQQVAEALAPYVGEVAYACDDESDAVAVGVAWLLDGGYIDGQKNNVRLP